MDFTLCFAFSCIVLFIFGKENTQVKTKEELSSINKLKKLGDNQTANICSKSKAKHLFPH